MFDVLLQQPLYKDPTKRDFGKMFFRELQLPFAPYVGLRVIGETWSSWPIASVQGDLGKKWFFCTLEDRAPDASLGTTYNGLFEHLEIEEGWIPAHKWKRHET